jgi:hypothetical protein
MDDFNRLLDEYKNQYLQFLATGEEAYKTAYKRAMDSIEETISSKREAVDSEKNAMKQFAASYEKTNKELGDMVTTSPQEQHDAYIGSKDRYTAWTYAPPTTPSPTVDVSVGYNIILRFGIFLLLLPVLFYVGMILPYRTYANQGLTFGSTGPLSP